MLIRCRTLSAAFHRRLKEVLPCPLECDRFSGNSCNEGHRALHPVCILVKSVACCRLSDRKLRRANFKLKMEGMISRNLVGGLIVGGSSAQCSNQRHLKGNNRNGRSNNVYESKNSSLESLNVVDIHAGFCQRG